MAEPVIVTIPHDTVNDESVRILLWKVPSGSQVVKDQHVCDIETSKALVEMCAPVAGIVEYNAVVGSEVLVGSKIFQVLPQADAKEDALRSAVVAQKSPERATGANGDEVVPAPRLTPLARCVAVEHGIDPAVFPPGALVRKADVLREAGKIPPEVTTPLARKVGKEAVANDNIPVVGVPIVWTELPRRKKIEARTLGMGQAASLQSSVTRVCHASTLRARLGKLGLPALALDALLVFEAARVLRKYSVFNSVHGGGRIGQYQEINVGWAIDGGEGLFVPVIKQADKKGFHEILVIMEQDIDAYAANSFAPSDLSAGTFTVSNLSADGVSFFQPLISQGQAAILGVGTGRTAENHELLYLTLAFDHQIGEGRTAAHFLRDLADRLEAHNELGSSETFGRSNDERYCVLCQRDADTLRQLNGVLVRSEIPAGLVCSICLGGY
jgi:pyruvate/2-oxoglutarate dehydrogenase complex dihydrolipoamide acyltransferase (E2) component